MKVIYCLMILLWPIVSPGQAFNPLSVGDVVPDLLITNVHNYKSTTIRLASLKGQAVIIDFWASWCGSCIATFPAMEKLQKEFQGRLKIIMVNDYYPDSSEKIKSFLQKREERTEMPFTLTYSLRDTALRQLFPYRQIPHDVWIDGTSKVVAITSAEEVNSENIISFLKNGTIQLPLKDDSRMFDRAYPLLTGNNGGNSFLYRSVITGFKDGLGSSIGQETDSTGRISRVYAINSPLLTLLEKAYPNVFRVPLSRLVIKGDSVLKDSILNTKAPLYCYEIITKPATAPEIQTFMQQDLYRWFGLTARNQEEKIDCYVLTTGGAGLIKKAKPGIPMLDIEPETAHKIFINEPLSALTALLERLTRKTIVDESGFSARLDLAIPGNIYNFSLEQIKQFLRDNGFNLVAAKRKMNAIVIAKKKGI